MKRLHDLVIPAPSERVSFGRRAEDAVAQYMQERGMLILGRNERAGRDELDIVARLGSTLVICEVRASVSEWLYDPIETIDERKIERIKRGTCRWLIKNRVATSSVRFDAASVLLGHQRARIHYYEDAF